ncbi:hypothetical protein SAMN04487851_11423 [Prevotella sp. tc2-28]|uniref:hypothetical protein n=1 Tax=Prevotella sp. tc2-28 TaxID=1761888 RepID=UPI000895DF21|nr:hypothetical protein [Prevotella sp. tc2-28]SEA78791.1 hypothetical protein SAMN04487851_11423 [Prevotella sp. tc2-28]
MSKAEEFIQDYTRNCSNEFEPQKAPPSVYNPWLTPNEARKAVEIAREEVIEKACEYLDLHCNEVKTEDNGIAGWIDNEFIDNFRKAMRNEIQDKVQRPHKKI